MAYRLSVPTVTPVQVVYPTVEELLTAVRELVEGDEIVELTIHTVMMSTEEIAALPEFDGY